MRKHINRDPTLSARQLKALMPDLQHLATRSIQNICQKTLALPSRKMAKKPVLTEQMKEKRMTFCHQYGHWTVDDWKKVMFSDESHFELNTFSRGLCRRPVGFDRFDVRFIRVGHSILFRSVRYVLLHSKKRMLHSFPFFSRVFGDL